jgi:hypothetical protein
MSRNIFFGLISSRREKSGEIRDWKNLEFALEVKGVEYEMRMLAKESAWFCNKKIVLDNILSNLDQDERQLEVSPLVAKKNW